MRNVFLIALFALAACKRPASPQQAAHPDECMSKTSDWCNTHQIEESKCAICNPTLLKKPIEFPASADVTYHSPNGEDVDVATLLAPGKITVVDFYAPWCAPCRDLDVVLASHLQAGSNFALRKLNVVSWETPIAQRYLKGQSGIPFVQVYSEQGALLATLVEDKWKTIGNYLPRTAGSPQ